MDIYVYAIRCGPYVKIGLTRDLRARMATLALPKDPTTKPADLPIGTQPLELLGYLEGDRQIEKAFHEAFRPERAAGEWFYATERITAWAATLLQSIPDGIPAGTLSATVVYHVGGEPPEGLYVREREDDRALPAPVEF